MSAKLLHALSDENPDLQKQIGCMTGIFQLFDRHHILTPKRTTGYTSHKKPPSVHSHFSNSNHGDECHSDLHTAKDKNSSKNVIENHRVSMESARASFSSSSCSSSFSSVECNRTSQPETYSFDRAINQEQASKAPSYGQANSSAHLRRKSSDFRDVVKDSIYKEGRALSVKTTAQKDTVNHGVKHRDSPRPLQVTRSVDESVERGINGKYKVPVDPLNALTKLQEAPQYFHDTREPPRSSPFEVRDRTSFSVPKDTPRLSYDGREIPRSSFDSRDTFKSNTKLRELPRLSLDSRQSSMRGSDSDSKSNSFLGDFQNSGGNSNRTSNTHQGLESHKHNHSVVAKLMGLEAIPKSLAANDGSTGPTRTSIYPGGNHDSLSKSSRTTSDCKQNSISPRNYLKESVSPRLRNPDAVTKPLPNSRFPVEPAPWRQMDSSHTVQKPVFRSRDSPPRGTSASPSVYAEIEKRLKELEFKQSDKDLRALKQILDAMHAKGLLETEKQEDQRFVSDRNYDNLRQNILDQNERSARQSPVSRYPVSTTAKGNSSPRTFESPIVIMKPARLVKKSGIPASSVIPIEGISDLRKLQRGNIMENKKSSVNNRMAKDLPYKLNPREPAKLPLNSTDRKASTRNLRSTNSPARSSQLPRENMVNLGRSSGSVSPRLQQKKLDLEKRSRPPTPTSDLTKPRKSSLRQPMDSGSPNGRRRPRSLRLQQSDDQMSEASGETRNRSYQGDEISVQSDSNISLASQIDEEVTSADRSGHVSNCFFNHGSRSPSRKITNNMTSLKQKKPSTRQSEDVSVVDFMTVAPEQPSPVSVLDASFYSDDLPSPERKTLEPFRDDIHNLDVLAGEKNYKPMDQGYLSDDKEVTLSTEISRKKLENVEQLVQKLRQLNSNHDEASTDYIASLCENTDPDHRYISEILLASGLLLRDLGSGLSTLQLHKSGHPINPDLFVVLEQTKSSNGFSKGSYHEKSSQSKSNQEKVHRKLVFDAVNEILEAKFASTELCQHTDKLAGRTLNGQQLLKELCSEIEQLQANENSDSSFDDADDFLKTILCRDVMSQTEKWTDFHSGNSGVVLDVERLIFKDLIDEIISGEASSIRARPGRRCRQLFAK
ncbi:hypothetical protein IFM89_011728 [Coptis chinensis]|uniref:DUF4378 domain-containing protein n=1 Tax=Coptis chinensis TaxID=261450 RepID=A0A835IW90_9MAGN|nr:hypothetical protein IFM89_011728 [Coptis chinensis]